MPLPYMEPLCTCVATTTTTHTHTHNKVCLTKFLILLQSCLLILNHVFIYYFIYFNLEQ